MSKAKVMMLEGANGHTFFLRETLLERGIVDRVDMVHHVEDALSRVRQRGMYDLVIVDLSESWDEGMQLGHQYYFEKDSCPMLILAPPDVVLPQRSSSSIIVVPTPRSLNEFAHQVTSVLAQINENSTSLLS